MISVVYCNFDLYFYLFLSLEIVEDLKDSEQSRHVFGSLTLAKEQSSPVQIGADEGLSVYTYTFYISVYLSKLTFILCIWNG